MEPAARAQREMQLASGQSSPWRPFDRYAWLRENDPENVYGYLQPGAAITVDGGRERPGSSRCRPRHFSPSGRRLDMPAEKVDIRGDLAGKRHRRAEKFAPKNQSARPKDKLAAAEARARELRAEADRQAGK